MKVLSLVLSVSFLTSLALAQGATGVAAVSGVAPQPAPEVLAGPGLPPGVRSEAISADSLDAKAVRVILDANGLTNVTVADVAVFEGGRIVGLYLQNRGVEDIPDAPASTLSYLDQLRTLHVYGNRALQLPLFRGLPWGIETSARTPRGLGNPGRPPAARASATRRLGARVSMQVQPPGSRVKRQV